MLSFVDFVIMQIEAEGADIAESLMGDDYLVAKGRGGRWINVKGREGPNDWSAHIGWNPFGYDARIIRGPEGFSIKATRKQARRLAMLEKAIWDERKARQRRAKQQKKAEQLAAGWL